MLKPALKMQTVKATALPLLLAVAGVLISVGVFRWSVPAGWVASGVLLAGWSVLFLLEVPEPKRGGGEP